MPEITHLVIANRACAMFGQEPLQSLDDETPGGQRVKLIYDSLLSFCLDLTPWTFQRETVELARLVAVEPIMGFSTCFAIPKGFVILPSRILSAEDQDAVITEYEIEGDKLYCDSERVWAQLLTEQHPERWSGAFTHAFTVGLAGKLALAISDDRPVAQALTEEAFGPPSMNYRGGLMGAAIQQNARNSPVRKIPQRNPLLDAWGS